MNKKMHFLIPTLLFIFTLAPWLCAQTPVWRYYELSDTLVVEAEREIIIPRQSTVAMKLPLPLQKTPASVGVVSQALLKAQNAVILSEALRNISGVNVQQGFGIYDYFYVRGFNSLEGSLILTDGTMEPEVSFYNLYNIDRVEVLKGPGAFLYGGNPLSGTINMVKKKPVFGKDLTISLGGGSFATFNGSLDYNFAKPQSGLAFRLNSFYKRSDMYRKNKENNVFAVNPTLTYEINQKSTANFDVEFIRGEHMPDSGIPILLLENRLPDIDNTADFQNPQDFSQQTVFRGKFSYDFVVNDAIVVHNKLYYTNLAWKSLGTLVTGAAPYTFFGPNVVNRIYSRLDDRQKIFGNQLEARMNFTTGKVQHTVLAGIEWSSLRDNFTLASGAMQPVDLRSPEQLDSPLFPFGEQMVAATTAVLAPYFADRIELTSQLDLFIGARFDRLRFDETEYKTDRQAEQFSPLAGLTFSPSPLFSIYANAGKAFAAPSTRVVGQRKPEKSEQQEIGIKALVLNKKMTLATALYRIDRENMAIPDESLVLQENGSQRSQGVEFEIQAKTGEGTHLFLSYAFNDAEMTEFTETVQAPESSLSIYDWSGQTAPFAPKHLANLWINKQFKNGLSLGLGGRYIGEQYIWMDNNFKLGATTIFDATISYQMQRWRWTLNLKNIGNSRYYEEGFRNYSVIPAFPFSLFSSVEFYLN